MRRSLPAITPDNRAFWTGGKNGTLMIARCCHCRTYVHPPTSFCPACENRTLVPEAVSGRGTVATYTVNFRQWMPGQTVPYVLALVELDEDVTIRLPANIIGTEPANVFIGMPVEVVFEQVEDIHVPQFRARAA